MSTIVYTVHREKTDVDPLSLTAMLCETTRSGYTTFLQSHGSPRVASENAWTVKNNRKGSGNPHPKHATAQEKSLWITRRLSKVDLANTFALESEYGYPSSRAKGKTVGSRDGPDKYREWQEQQDERCGYLPEEWNALRPKKKPTGMKNRTNGYTTAGPSGGVLGASSTTAHSMPSVSFFTSRAHRTSAEMSQAFHSPAFHSPMQPDLTSFTGHWMPPATDLPSSTPSLYREDPGLTESMMSSTSSSFSLNTPVRPFTEVQINHSLPTYGQSYGYQFRTAQPQPHPAMPSAPQPPPAMFAPNTYNSGKQPFGSQQMVAFDPAFSSMSGMNSGYMEAIPEEEDDYLSFANRDPASMGFEMNQDPASLDFGMNMDQQAYGLANPANYPQYGSGGFPFFGNQQASSTAPIPNMSRLAPQPSQYGVAAPGANGQYAMPGQATNMNDAGNMPYHSGNFTWD
ncbi:hypothetical protein AC578_2325 [Pseudocercospora eumusae]|uniref:Uncharacterized protein n=1 Tax=Pseudocercospora eumusae TaxID=321146 RepID=A0A139HXU6_9PEZI|nr:hypothetical protein AC578_2325 [Pseudocercospora eumusae]